MVAGHFPLRSIALRTFAGTLYVARLPISAPSPLLLYSPSQNRAGLDTSYPFVFSSATTILAPGGSLAKLLTALRAPHPRSAVYLLRALACPSTPPIL